MQDSLQRPDTKLKPRNYSIRTIRSYIHFLPGNYEFTKAHISELNTETREGFLLQERSGKGVSQTIICISAGQFFQPEVVRSSQEVDVEFARKSEKLPVYCQEARKTPLLAKIGIGTILLQGFSGIFWKRQASRRRLAGKWRSSANQKSVPIGCTGEDESKGTQNITSLGLG